MKNIQGYDQLTTVERVHLLLRAMRRGDDEDFRRLWETAARATYTMVDQGCVDRFTGSRDVALAFIIHWQSAHREVKDSQRLKAAFDLVVWKFDRGFEMGLRAGKHIPNDDHPVWQEHARKRRECEVLCEEADQRYRIAVARLKGVQAGWLRFCRAAGLESKEVLAWCKEIRKQITAAQDLLQSDIPADERETDAVYRDLCAIWPDGDPTAEGAEEL